MKKASLAVGAHATQRCDLYTIERHEAGTLVQTDRDIRNDGSYC